MSASAQVVSSTLGQTRDEWLAVRNRGLGGSDAGAVCGISPYKTPVDVWLEKTGQAEPVDLSDNQAVAWGNILEDTIATEFSKRTGMKVQRRNATLKHPEHDWMLAHVDRLIVGTDKGPGILEVKTAGQYMSDKWGDPGTDQVPDEYALQVAHYLAVTGYAWARLAVLIGGRDLRVYDLPRDEDLIALLMAREEKFWTQHVETRLAPPPSTAGDIETLYAIDNGESLPATSEIESACEKLSAVKLSLKVGEQAKEELEQKVKAAMEDNSVLVDANGLPLITWKKARDSQRFDAKRFKSEHPDLHSQYLNTVPGSRRFLVK